MTYRLTAPDGTLYCPMAGHAQRDCPGYPSPEHHALSVAGIGWTSVPGPTDAELLEEIASDRELSLDEYHGRDPRD